MIVCFWCVSDCQYTCHYHCIPSVTLDCTTVSPGTAHAPVATPTDIPSPSASEETSLTDQRTFVNQQDGVGASAQQSPQPPSIAQSSFLDSQRSLVRNGSVSLDSSPLHTASSTSSQQPQPSVSQTVSSSISSTLSSSAADSSKLSSSISRGDEKDLNQNAKTSEEGGGERDVVLVNRNLEEISDATNVSNLPFIF